MESTEKNAGRSIVNPCLVVRVKEKFFDDHDTTFAKEDWVKANDILIARDGPEAWLHMFLRVLSGSFRESLASPLNPYHAVTMVKPEVAAGLIGAEDWVAINVKLIDELGSNQWLWSMLNLLESGLTNVS